MDEVDSLYPQSNVQTSNDIYRQKQGHKRKKYTGTKMIYFKINYGHTRNRTILPIFLKQSHN